MTDNIFSEYVKEYRVMVFRIAFGYVRNTDDADDITQEAFLKLYKRHCDPDTAGFDTPENLKAWLIRVTINQSKSFLRTAWRTKRTDLDDLDNLKTQSLSEDSVELYEYIKGLKPKYRTVIYLYYYEEYSVKEIAAILKIRETTVTTQLSRARNQLKEILLAEGIV